MKISTLRKHWLGTGSALRVLALTGAGAVISISATPAFAQNVAEEEPAAEAAQPIIVTGSRIASATIESIAPLQVLDATAIADSGVVNIQELLLENPVFGTPTLSRTNSAFLTSGTGVATVDLRALGTDRTLVLANGRRIVASVANSSTVDLNVIPTQFIERVDVLTGGSSAIYGSDALGGVVNFVYRRKFEGIEGQAQYGITERGDDERYLANITAGTNFAEDRGNIMIHLGYSKEGGVLSRERANTYLDDSSKMVGETGLIEDWGVVSEPFLSGFAPQGTFTTRVPNPTPENPNAMSNVSWTYGPGGLLQPCTATNAATCTGLLGSGTGPTGFNRQYYRTIAVPVERYLFSAAGEYEITDKLNFFFEGTYNRTASAREIEPFALASDGSTGVYPATGRMPIEHRVFGIDGLVANGLVPDAIAAVATDTDGDGLKDIGFSRRLTEIGSRNGSTERDFYRFVVGFDGTLFDNRFRWDASYNYGRVTENQTSNGQINIANFRNGLAVMADINDVNGNGSTTDLICIDAEARANGCVPVNIFGAGNISQEAVNYVNAESTYRTGITQQVLQANLSGSPVDLPAGPLGIAVGVEYRQENSYSDYDSLTNLGQNGGNQLPDTSGGFHVAEFFAEVKVPLLADTPFFNYLEVGGAVRLADYSTVGGVTSWNVTAVWSPVEDLRFRGTYAKSVRAPNIGELYSGLAQTFPSGLVDPCEDIGATGGGALGDNCRAAPGVAGNIADNGAFTLTQPDLQGISGFDSGNPDLNEEKSTSWTVGGVFTPRSLGLGNLALTVDYYNIEIKDVIAQFGRQFILNQCYVEGNTDLCQQIIRRPGETSTNSSGSIEFINAPNLNAASIETEGMDVAVNWSAPVGLLGNDRLALRGAYTHIFKWDYFQLPGEAADPSDGEIGMAKDSFTASAAYGTDEFKVNFTGTYRGRSYEDDQFCMSYGYEAKCVSVPAQFYLDMQAQYFVSKSVELYFGIDNLFDKSAPRILTNTTFNTTGTDTAADVYDVFGRRFYTGARVRF
ncbi:TonB-dependent receptor [Altererythrobacter xixiisoli]|uniref:TonB-dependent receptor n=1 Tax=Croceibacterium xixiisoli TaxID=1476466 RepID=A0A6I4TS50_9SPHN|nr:TonB-dependent receptor [Croceibacterium xixiisoli]MXO98139.1 TonB-dependent receptor [Croceibacterium xixiisoli]